MNDTVATRLDSAALTHADYSFAVNLMQFLVVPTFVLDAEGKVLIWNKACERLTGLPASEVIGTREHWRGFYDTPRPCLSDLFVQDRMAEIEALYAAHDDLANQSHGIHAENWCVMPRLGTQLYLAIDAGPIYDGQGKLLAVVETLRDMTSLKKAQTELELLASHDGLTGIVNRRGFDAKMSIEWSKADRDKLPLSLLLIDVDHFKRFNDTYGHPAGDDCLKRIAKVLAKEALRPTDLVARYGGEEFAIVLPTTESAGAAIVARRVLQGVLGQAIAHSGNDPLGVVSVSIGVATLVPDQDLKLTELIAHADRSLYDAKHGGRNRFVAHEADEV